MTTIKPTDDPRPNPAPSPPRNGASERLRQYMEAHFEAGRVPSTDTRVMRYALDAALAEERRHVIQQIRTDLTRAFVVNGSYNRTAIWQAIQRVTDAAMPDAVEADRP